MLEMPKKSSRFYQFSQSCVFEVFCKLHIAVIEIVYYKKIIKEGDTFCLTPGAQGKKRAPIHPLKP